MGYSTDFHGQFNLNKQLSAEDHNFLEKLAATRRMKRSLPEGFGVEGEFYVEDDEESVIDFNEPPETQPGLWCNWAPTKDGKGIEWNGREKFYDYVEWLDYIIEKILQPRGYVLNGKVEWMGQDPNDTGIISVIDNEITVADNCGFGVN